MTPKFFSIIILGFLIMFLCPSSLLAEGKTSSLEDSLIYGGGLSNVGEQVFEANNGVPKVGVTEIVSRIIRVALGFLGIIFLTLIIYAGFNWMTAGGDKEKVEKSKKLIINAIIGLAIVLASYTITWFITSNLVGATTGTKLK